MKSSGVTNEKRIAYLVKRVTHIDIISDWLKKPTT
jgi:hypothetical protein